jgi:predicted nucleic acid-binding protein
VKIVIDASFAMLWLGKEQESKTVAEFDGRVRAGSIEMHAPELFLPEASNAVWKSVRRGRRTLDEGVQMFETVLQMPIQLHRHRDLTTAAFDLALRREITVYDSLYVALALKEVLPLFTADRRLASATEDLLEVVTA